MNKIWSQFVQSSEELYRSRALRFNAANKNLWLAAMEITDGINVLEIGCGGGIFCHRIKEFLPNCTVTGMDRDAGHIEYATAKTAELGLDCKFVVGDALELPFTANTFDACTSHTVLEHVPAEKFLSEQHRVLKPGGVTSVLCVQTGMTISPENWKPTESEENDLLSKAWDKAGNFDKEHGIGAYGLRPDEILAALEKAGFTNVNVKFICAGWYAPDNADVSDEMAIEMINVNRLHTLSSMTKALNIAPDGLTKAEAMRLAELVNQRYDARVDMYKKGEKLWDVACSTVLVATGCKK